MEVVPKTSVTPNKAFSWSQPIDDLMLMIFRNLQDEDLVRASRVCRSWHRVAQNVLLWTSLWNYNGFPPTEGDVTRQEYAKAAVYRAEIKKLATTAPEQSIKLVVTGSRTAGKTALLFSFVTNAYPAEYMPSAFDNHTKGMIVDGEAIMLGLWDTSGQEEYTRLRPLSYAQCDVVVITFSIMDRQSFADVSLIWKPEVDHYLPNIPTVLCGTNLEQRLLGTEHITTQQGHQLAKDLHCFAYVEVSAREGTNLRLLFETAVRGHRDSIRRGHRRHRRGSSCVIS